ncbi:hypothetical protein ACFLUC_03635 [Chloroflexota bacterium]
MYAKNDSPYIGEWHISRWSYLAWVETIIKSIAILIGISAFVDALSAGTYFFPTGLRLAQFIILGILSLGLMAAIFDRLRRREVGSMVFIIFNDLGHWGMLITLVFIPIPGAFLVSFSVLMLVGDLIKIVSIKLEDFSLAGVSSNVLYCLTSFYIFGYALLLLFEWLV